MSASLINDIVFILCVVVYVYGLYLLLVGRKFDERRSHLKTLSSSKFYKQDRMSVTEYILTTSSLNKIKIVNKFSVLLTAQEFKGKYTIDLILMLLLFLLLFGIRIFSVLSFIEMVAFTVVLLALPITYLFIRLQNRQSRGSLEGEEFLSDLLGFYKVSGSMLYALESCVDKSDKLPLLSKSLITLINGLDNYRTDDELRYHLTRFENVIGTKWCKKLTNSIYSDIRYGINQTKAIESLIKDLDYGRTLFEDSKRLNSETVVLIKYMSPIMYVGSLLTAVYYLDMPLGNLIHNQLFDPTGVKLFAFIVIGMLINYSMLHYMNNNKLDIMG